jgi:hypothetical protein
MSEYIGDLPDVHFGEASEKEINWRAEKIDEENEDAPASDDLIAQIGFNPDDLEEK